MAAQRKASLTGPCIVEYHIRVGLRGPPPAAGGRVGAGGGEGAGLPRPGRPGGGRGGGAGGAPPAPPGPVLPRRDEALAVGAERHAENAESVPLESEDFLASCPVPD